jgi:hypothetical protein
MYTRAYLRSLARVKNVGLCDARFELPGVQHVGFGAVGMQAVTHRRNGEPPTRWLATMPNFIHWLRCRTSCYRMFPLIWP